MRDFIRVAISFLRGQFLEEWVQNAVRAGEAILTLTAYNLPFVGWPQASKKRIDKGTEQELYNNRSYTIQHLSTPKGKRWNNGASGP